MAEPGIFNILLHRNVTKILNFELKEASGAAFDLTGYTVMADAVGAILPGSRLELNPTIDDAIGGVINMTISKTITGGLVSTDGSPPTEIPDWDLLLDLGGVTTKPLTGKLYVRETITT